MSDIDSKETETQTVTVDALNLSIPMLCPKDQRMLALVLIDPTGDAAIVNETFPMPGTVFETPEAEQAALRERIGALAVQLQEAING